MEDIVIISSIKEQEKKTESSPNHKSPLKPIDQMRVKIDKLQLDVDCIKRDIRIIMDAVNHQQEQVKKGYWW
jgi:hypothetical protein